MKNTRSLQRLSAYLVLLTPLALTPVATASCVGSKKPNKEQQTKGKSIDKYVKTEAPADITKLDINFDDKITLLGYKMKSTPVKPGERVKFTLYWKVNQALGEDGWRLFTHIMSSDNKRLLNIDNVGPLRDSGKGDAQLHPPSKWEAGKVYVDEQSFKVPKKAQGDDIQIISGIWKANSRLHIKEGPHAGTNRALVATLKVTGKSPTKPPEAQVPSLRVDRLEKGQSINIDGKLTDKAWETAASTGPFVNVATGKPDTGPVQGEAKLLWDAEFLYIGFTVKDKDVTGGFDKDEKDPHLWTKDCVEIMLDPDGDGDNKDYYEVQINPQNLVFDSQFDDYNLPKGGENGPFGHQEWSAKLKSAVKIDGTLDKPDDEDQGYTVEVKLPWSSFDKAKQAPPELGQTWRMNFYAMQNNGGVAWSPILKQGNFHKASRFGKVLFAAKDWINPNAAKDSEGPSPERIEVGKKQVGEPTADPSARKTEKSPSTEPEKKLPLKPKPTASAEAPKAPAP
jgi:hypothetical protein